ncbi:MAG: beta-N-acetylglucosaminidase domain-containing protein [Actinomycetes bacterium]
MPGPIPRRGVIEGFYGRPWTFDERADALRFLADVGMNAYVYAPKDDPRHRAEWRLPYDEPALDGFRRLAAIGREVGVRVGFAISPGLDLDPTSAGDRGALVAKAATMVELGWSWIVLAFDDIPLRNDAASGQAAVASEVLDGILERDPGAELTLVPTEYVGGRSSPYLTALGAALDPRIEVMWTGPTVCSPTITGADAAARAACVGGRAPLLWDNVPVNDGSMASSLHLGPYRGRGADLAPAVSGILLNPMNQAHCSRIAIAAAAEYMAAPDAYDPDAAWVRAVALVAEDRDWLAPIAAAMADSPVVDPTDLPAARVLDRALAGDGTAWTRLADLLRTLRAAGRAVRAAAAGGDPVAAEIVPWCDAIERETATAGSALRLHDALAVDPVDATAAMELAVGTAWAWSAAVRGADRTVLGPRSTVHTAIVQLPDGRPAFDVGTGLRFDASVVDRLVRRVLDDYDAWRRAEDGAA